MSIFNIILGIVLLVSSAFVIRANISTSQAERRRKLIKVTVVLLIAFLIYAFTAENSSRFIGMYFVGLGVIWPLLIAFFINRKTIEDIIGYSKPHWAMLVAGLTMVPMVFLSMIPNTFTYSEGKPVIDSDFLVFRISFLLVAVPATVLFLLLAIKGTVIHKSGIFHDGLLWAWSDFKTYQWINGNRPKKASVLLLSTKSLWLNREIKLNISPAQKEVIDGLLVKEVG